MKVRAVVINLKEDVDRRLVMEDMLKSLDLKYEFFDACTPTYMPDDIRKMLYDDNGIPYGKHLLPGEIGVYASHLTIMRDVANGMLPSPLLVLEDDAILDEEGLFIIEKAADKMVSYKEEIDYINFFQNGRKAAIKKIALHRGIKLIKNYIPSWGMYCYLISKVGGKKFLQWKSSRSFPVDVDVIYSSLTSDMNVWETSRTVCRHRTNISSIIDPHGFRNERPIFTLKSARPLAKKKYGKYHDFMYKISRKVWKTKRMITD